MTKTCDEKGNINRVVYLCYNDKCAQNLQATIAVDDTHLFWNMKIKSKIKDNLFEKIHCLA